MLCNQAISDAVESSPLSESKIASQTSEYPVKQPVSEDVTNLIKTSMFFSPVLRIESVNLL